MNGIIPLAQAAGTGMLDQVGRNMGNALGSMAQNALSNATGVGTYGTTNIGNASGATNNLNDSRMMLDPRQQMALQEGMARDNARFQQGMQQQNLGYGAELANQVRNNDTTRSMAIAAQQNAAANVSNQLNNLASARSANANMIQGALTGGTNIR